MNQCVVKTEAVRSHRRRGAAAASGVFAVLVARAAPAGGCPEVAVDQTAIDRIGEIELADVEAQRGVSKVGLMDIGPGSADVAAAVAAAAAATAVAGGVQGLAVLVVLAAPSVPGDRLYRRTAMNRSRCLLGGLLPSQPLRALLVSARLSGNHRPGWGALQTLRRAGEESCPRRGVPAVMPTLRLARAGSLDPGEC